MPGTVRPGARSLLDLIDASGVTVDTGKYIGVFEKRDGKWGYIRDTWNSDNPPAPAEAGVPGAE